MRFLAKLPDYLIAAAIVVVMDIILFHHGSYFPWLRPDSYSGRVEGSSRRFDVMLDQHAASRAVVAMGDSTTGSAIQEAVVERAIGEPALPLFVINLAQGGSTPRSWVTLLDDPRIAGETVAEVIVGIFPGSMVRFDVPKPDLDIIKTRMRVRRAVSLASTYRETEMRLFALTTSLFRSPLFGDDLRDLFRDPRARVRSVRANQEDETSFREGYLRENLADWDLSSFRLGDDGRLVVAEIDPIVRGNENLRKSVQAALVRVHGLSEPRRIPLDPIKLDLLADLVRLLDGRGVGTTLAVLPRSPYPTGSRDLVELESVYGDLHNAGLRVSYFCRDDLLDRLESPLYFKDLLHLNRLGADLYSSELGSWLMSRDDTGVGQP